LRSGQMQVGEPNIGEQCAVTLFCLSNNSDEVIGSLLLVHCVLLPRAVCLFSLSLSLTRSYVLIVKDTGLYRGKRVIPLSFQAVTFCGACIDSSVGTSNGQSCHCRQEREILVFTVSRPAFGLTQFHDVCSDRNSGILLYRTEPQGTHVTVVG
jgi:hypothetical protein